MLIAVCYGQGEPEFATANGLVFALRNLGHTVIRVGPYYNYGDHNSGIPGCEVVLEDRPFPELYTYEEVLARTGPVDLMLQIEPHFYLYGPKPKGLKSAYYFTDPHRGGYTYYELASRGSFDFLFCAQPAYTHYFNRIAPTACVKVGFDARRKIPFSPKTYCDISFCGETGRVGFEYDDIDPIGKFARRLSPVTNNFKFSAPNYDYAERAVLLTYLSQDFDLRIYKGPLGDKYMDAVAAGAIGFHRSLLNDISLRCFEVWGAGRVLLADRVPGLLSDSFCQLYDNISRYPHAPFLLEYKLLRDKIQTLLRDRGRLAENGAAAMAYAHSHTWEQRAREMLRYFSFPV